MVQSERSASPWRALLAAAILLCLTSAPYMSLWRWVTKSYNDDHSWPYLTTVVAPATFGSVMLIRDVVIPNVRSTRRLTASETAAPMAAALLAIWVLLSTAWSSSPAHTSWHAMIAALVIATAVWFGLALPLRQQLCALFAAMQVATIGSLVAVAIARFRSVLSVHR